MCPNSKTSTQLGYIFTCCAFYFESNWWYPLVSENRRSKSWQQCKWHRTAQLWHKHQVHWKLYVQIKSSDKPPCRWHWTRRRCTSQSLTIYHRPEESTESRDMRSKATSDMKILSAGQRTGGAPPQQIPSPFSGMKQHSFLTSEAEVYAPTSSAGFLTECCIADNADLLFRALISLSMGLPLLVASTDNKLDLCLWLEDCTADAAHMTRQLALPRYI